MKKDRIVKQRNTARQVSVAVLLQLIALSGFAQELFRPDVTERTTAEINYQLPFTAEKRDLTVEIVDGYAIMEGDIILYKVEMNEDAGRNGGQYRWPNSTIPYEIVAGHPGADNIREAIRRFNAATHMQVVPRSGESDYVRFIHGTGCSSYIGRLGGAQSVDIGWCINSLGSIQHEILHAAGMYHEQSRADRDSFVRINYENIQSGRENNFRRVTDAISFCEYDFGSLMHYSAMAFTVNGQPTITPLVPLPPGVSMGQRTALSSSDISGLASLYGNPAGCCQDHITVTANVSSGTDNREAARTITASNVISGTATATYHAGLTVTLNPGFYAQTGVSFHAYNEGCTGNFRLITRGEYAAASESIAMTGETGADEVLPGSGDDDLILYPNPADQTLKVLFGEEGDVLTVSIYDMAGQTVLTADLTEETQSIAISDLENGSYFISVLHRESGKVKNGKFVIAR